MALTIDLPSKCIRLHDHDVLLRFATDARFFYLQVLALIAEATKQRHKPGDTEVPFVPIGAVLPAAWTAAKALHRPIRSKDSLRMAIYQAWHGRMDPTDEAHSYTIEPKHAARNPEVYDCIRRLFSQRRGPKGEYRINHPPELVTIISTKDKSAAVGEDALAETLVGLNEEEIAARFLSRLSEISTPSCYNDVILASNNAIVPMFGDESIFRTNDKGGFDASLKDFAEVYLRGLGITGLTGEMVLDQWFKELELDPWWIESMLPSARPPAVLGERLPSPYIFADYARHYGDGLSMMVVFHAAYRAITTASYRESFISDLKNQTTSIREKVFMGWVAMLGGDAWIKVAEDPVVAFRSLQWLVKLKSRFVQ